MLSHRSPVTFFVAAVSIAHFKKAQTLLAMESIRGALFDVISAGAD